MYTPKGSSVAYLFLTGFKARQVPEPRRCRVAVEPKPKPKHIPGFNSERQVSLSARSERENES